LYLIFDRLYAVCYNRVKSEENRMDDFIANKIIDDFVIGNMTAQEAWRNVSEARETISDEKYDEITALILEDLVDAEMVEEDEDVELEIFFQDEEDEHSWLDSYYDEWHSTQSSYEVGE
jgi:hypothetical protein